MSTRDEPLFVTVPPPHLPEEPDVDVDALFAYETSVPNIAFDAALAFLRDFVSETDRCEFCDVTRAQLVLNALDLERPDAQRAAVLLLERARRAREAT